MWLQALQMILGGQPLLYLVLGTAIGMVVGILPALGPAFGVALMLPFTFGMDPVSAVVFLCAIHAACAYGDSISSILVRTPGSAATVPSTWDGYPLTEQGKGAMALGISAFGSFFGGLVGWICMVLIAGLISRLALSIGAPEYFALGVMALLLISIASQGQTIKGLIWACLGLAISFIGADPVTGLMSRFSFGIVWLEGGGIPLVVSMLGLFAVPQIMGMLTEGAAVSKVTEVKGSVLAGLYELLRRPLTVIRSAMIGLYMGVLPALGTTVATTTAYLVEQRYSSEKDKFGKGAAAGVIAAEVSKGACVVADLIPTFMLGVPGSMATAITLAALMYHGLQPGPRFLSAGTVAPYAIFVGVLLAQFMFAVVGTVMARPLARVAYTPTAILAPILAVLTFMGVFAERRVMFDLILALLFGLVGWISRRLDYPVVCIVLGVLLGPIVEVNFHRSVQIGMGSYLVFVARPITVTLLLITLGFLSWPWISALLRRAGPSGLKPEGRKRELPNRRALDLEVAMLTVVGLLFAAMVVMGVEYGPATRLFPLVVTVTGVLLVVYRIVGLLLMRKSAVVKWAVSGSGAPGTRQGMPLWVSIVCLAGYVVATGVLGFALATLLFLAVAAMLAGYRRRGVVWGVAVGTVIFCILLGIVVRVPLPPGRILPPWLG